MTAHQWWDGSLTCAWPSQTGELRAPFGDLVTIPLSSTFKTEDLGNVARKRRWSPEGRLPRGSGRNLLNELVRVPAASLATVSREFKKPVTVRTRHQRIPASRAQRRVFEIRVGPSAAGGARGLLGHVLFPPGPSARASVEPERRAPLLARDVRHAVPVGADVVESFGTTEGALDPSNHAGVAPHDGLHCHLEEAHGTINLRNSVGHPTGSTRSRKTAWCSAASREYSGIHPQWAQTEK